MQLKSQYSYGKIQYLQKISLYLSYRHHFDKINFYIIVVVNKYTKIFLVKKYPGMKNIMLFQDVKKEIYANSFYP